MLFVGCSFTQHLSKLHLLSVDALLDADAVTAAVGWALMLNQQLMNRCSRHRGDQGQGVTI